MIQNWDRIKHKRVILRTIGQNTPANEKALQKLVTEGLQIVRYSPKERNIENFAGQDVMIRFYKDPEELRDWNGEDNRPVTFAQSLKGRAIPCHHDEVIGALIDFEGAKVYGPGNNDLGALNGGELTYENLKKTMRDSRVYVTAGTWPASYTLSLIEAMMTGMPIVTVSKQIAHIPSYEQIDFYEVDEIIDGSVDGFICDNVQEMREDISELLADHELAKLMSANARQKAIKLFGKETIKKQWAEFLG